MPKKQPHMFDESGKELKCCSTCREPLPLADFNREYQRWDGLAPRCRSCTSLALKGSYLKTSGQTSRAIHLVSTYNLTLEQYAQMMEKQNNVCAICKRPETSKRRNGTPVSMAVDHDHKTGQVRGLLCRPCNQAIGAMEDDTTRLFSAIEYLEQFK